MESEPEGGWFVVRPFVVAGTPLDPAVTIGCILLLSVIFVIEVLTPSVVVAAFAIRRVSAWSSAFVSGDVVRGSTKIPGISRPCTGFVGTPCP